MFSLLGRYKCYCKFLKSHIARSNFQQTFHTKGLCRKYIPDKVQTHILKLSCYNFYFRIEFICLFSLETSTKTWFGNFWYNNISVDSFGQQIGNWNISKSHNITLYPCQKRTWHSAIFLALTKPRAISPFEIPTRAFVYTQSTNRSVCCDTERQLILTVWPALPVLIFPLPSTQP